MDLDSIAKTICQNHYNRFTALRQKKQQSQGRKVGNYRIGGKLGEGSNGFVYSAYRLDNNKKLAVKIIPKVEDNLEQVANEIKILESISNKNIIKIQQVVSDHNKVFIFMELCAKGDLFCHIKNYGKLPEKQAAEIFIKIHSALQYLHEKGITHRDVKAENILLDGWMNPKLSDFGLAQFYNKSSPFLQTWCGSFNYVAPQILKKRRYKPELIDLWSLCVTLYIMLTGKQPFNRDGDRIATKQFISTFDWDRDVQISAEALDLFSSVFVPAQHRLRLREVKDTLFYKKYQYILDKDPEKQFQFGLHSTLDIESQEETRNNQKPQTKSVKKTEKQRQRNMIDDSIQLSKQFQTMIPIQAGSHIRNKIEVIKLFRDSRGVRSVEPSNKFRVKKSAPKRKQSIQDL